jgi:hypothetical protein
MISFRTGASTRDALATALRSYQDDPRLRAGLKGLTRDEAPVILSHVVAVWPAEADGSFRLAFSDNGGEVVWRAFCLAEIAAGRGLRQNSGSYEKSLGVTLEPAFEAVCALTHGLSIRPCLDKHHKHWSQGTAWIYADRDMPDPKRKKFASTAWRQRARAHEIYAGMGLAVAGRGIWNPQATILFDRPTRTKPPPVFDLSDEAAISALA